MRNIIILEENDQVYMSDFFRPLYRSADYHNHMDDWCPVNTYSGRPEDHLKWVPVSKCWGSIWDGKTVKEMCKLKKYEFVRGDIPPDHILD